MLFSAKIGAFEFVGDDIRLAVIKSSGRLPVVLELHEARAAYETPEERQPALVRALDDLLSRVKQKPTAYVLCASSAYSIVRLLTIPFRGKRRVSAAVPFELEPYLAFPIEELLVDFNTIAEINGQTEVLAVGMRRADVEEQLALLAEAGVVPEAVNIDAVGLTDLWQATHKSAKGLHAVLHVREGGANLSILHNKNLAHFRQLPLTAEQVMRSPALVAREVQNTLRAFLAKWRGEGEISKLHITGVVLEPEERESLSQALRLPVEDTNLFTRLKGAAKALPDGSEPSFNRWEASIGVAMAAAGGGLALDFVRDQRDWRSNAGNLVTNLMVSSCLGLLALLGAAYYFHYGTLRNNAEAAVLQGKIDELTKTGEALTQRGIGEDINLTPYTDPTMLEVLSIIGEHLPESKVSITEIRVAQPEAQGPWITIEGTAVDLAAFRQAFDSLKSVPKFNITEEPTLRTDNGITTFRVNIFRPGEELNETE